MRARTLALTWITACASEPIDAERTAPTPIVGADGEIVGGWARAPIFEFDRARIAPELRQRIRAWDFYSVFTPEFAVNITLAELVLADLGPTVLATVNLHPHGEGSPAFGLLLEDGATVGLLPVPGGDYRVDDPSGWLELGTDADGRRTVGFSFGDPTAPSLAGALTLAAPTGDSVALVTPFAPAGHFFYENKVPGLSASGRLSVRGRSLELPAGESFAVLDWVRAVVPPTIDWTWATAAGERDGSIVSLNLGTVHGDERAGNPNAVLVGGRLHKLGRVDWTTDLDDPAAPWRFRSPDGAVDLRLEPVGAPERQSLDLGVYVVRLTRPYGRFFGTVPLEDGRPLAIDGLRGAAEVNHIEW